MTNRPQLAHVFEHSLPARLYSAERELFDETLHPFLSAIPDALIVLDREGKVSALNDRAAMLWGEAPEKLFGRAFHEFMPSANAPERRERFEQAAEEGVGFRFEETCAGRVFDFAVSPLPNASGTVDGMVVVARDLARQAGEQQERACREKLFREIVEEQSELICRFQPDGRFTFVNTAFQIFFGGEPAGILGKTFAEVICESDRAGVKAHLDSLTPSAPTGTAEFMAGSKNGPQRWVQWNTRAFWSESGEACEFLAVGRDISLRKVAEEALLQVTSEKEIYRLNLQAVFQSIPDGILTVGTDMRVLESNRVLRDICPHLGKARPGMPLVCEADAGCGCACLEVVRQCLELRCPVKEHRVECKGGRPGQVVVLNASPLTDRHGGFGGAVLVIRDITQLTDLQKQLTERHHFQNIIGKSRKMQRVYDLVEQLADVDTTVLVTGESGTGKELVVDALHYCGARSEKPLVKVNCSALSESLLESELFGHVRGAFTGAIRDKIGRFQAAEGGTIFLDEIGDISPLIQLKLLRGLERKEFERVGDNRTYRTDVRVVAATNVDLMKKVREGVFREDLYYRLKVVVVELPPLRERREDIPLLAEHFLAHYRKEFGKRISGFDSVVMGSFMRYSWPGNVRELKHAVEHSCLLCRGERILPQDLPVELTSVSSQALGADQSGKHGLSEAEVRDALKRAGGNKSKAARILGISRRTIYRKIDSFKIS